MKNVFVSLLLLLSTQLFSQECSKEMLRQKPGTWKAGQQGSIQGVTAADLAKEKGIIGSIHKMISAGYKPTGCQISYSTVYGKNNVAGKSWVADPYHYSMYILRYLCDQNSADRSKYYVDISTPTTVNVTANVIYNLNNLYAADLPDDDFRGYLKLKQFPIKQNGVWSLGEEVVGDRGMPSEIKEYRWLITYDDKLPFVYMKRKEYLLIQKKRLEQNIRDEGSNDYYNKLMNNINQALKQPEADLEKPAICPWNDEQYFTGFVTEGTAGSFIAVKPNLDYYNKQLPKSSPQFFTVVYKVSKGDPVFEDNIAAIKQSVDFSALKNMLGK